MRTLGPIMTSTAFGLDSSYLFAAFFSSSLHSNSLGDPSLNLLVITLASLSLAVLFGVFHPVYKKRYCNILEFSFYLNLGAVSVATLYVSTNNGNQAAVIYTSTGVAFLTFACTVLFHIIQSDLSSHNVCYLAAVLQLFSTI